MGQLDRRVFVTGSLAVAATVAGVATARAAVGRQLYVGGYTSPAGRAPGLSRYQVNADGSLTAVGQLRLANPSFAVVAGGVLYAVNELRTGRVSALRLGSGEPRLLGDQPSGGDSPCHLTVFAGHLVTANYGDGSLAVHPVAADGSLRAATDLVRHTGRGTDPVRQAGPHAHQVVADPAGRYLLAVDLGNDTVYTYRLDREQGRLTQVAACKVAPGAGPRHLAFAADGRHAYLANELNSTLTVLAYDAATGRLRPLGSVAASAGDSRVRNYPGGIAVHGGRVYVSNRGHDTIGVFEPAGSGLRRLAQVPAGGSWPRHFAFGPGGSLYVAHQKGDTVAGFRLDRAGVPRPTGQVLAVGTPSCLVFG